MSHHLWDCLAFTFDMNLFYNNRLSENYKNILMRKGESTLGQNAACDIGFNIINSVILIRLLTPNSKNKPKAYAVIFYMNQLIFTRM